MVFNLTTTDQTASFTQLEQQLLYLTHQAQNVQSSLMQVRALPIPPGIYESINQLSKAITTIHQQLKVFDEERLSLRALANIGNVVNSSLEVDEVLQIVMDTIIRLTGAERCFLMLKNEQDELTMRIARNWEKGVVDPSEFAISSTIIKQVAGDGQAVLTTNAQQDPRFTGQQSIVAYNLRSILCVPLKVKSALIGVIYADNRIRSGLFTQKDRDLLIGFANQAAVALENARLFASVRKSLVEVTELKNLMDNVFASIASGVLTTDIQERILMCNRAAESILGQSSGEMVGYEMDQILPPLTPALKPHFQQVLKTNQAVVGVEISPTLQNRGQVDLRFSISPLKNGLEVTQGVAIVLDDLTEKKKLEAQRRLFERMVSPRVIEQLNPNSLQLGGHRTEITVLFADIRGFTSFSETVSPEQLVAVLNQYLAASAEEILLEEGTIDKFLGDAVMAWFNAPIPQPDHALRAVRAALGIRQALATLHARLPANSHLSFGVGIHTGEAVLGLVGTERRLEFTAIGDSVNTAKRIQENSGPGQILLSQSALNLVADYVCVEACTPILAKGKRDPIPVYQVICLK
jgi:PAS domain S-box-containing protein